MKFEEMEVLSPAELRRMVRQLMTDYGGQAYAAREIGVSQQILSGYLRGVNGAARKILDYFGLEKRQVFVKKGTPVESLPKLPGKLKY